MGDATRDVLPRLASDPDPVVRAKAAVAAALIRGDTGVEVARQLVKDPYLLARREASRSLAMLLSKTSDEKPRQVRTLGVFEVEFKDVKRGGTRALGRKVFSSHRKTNWPLLPASTRLAVSMRQG